MSLIVFNLNIGLTQTYTNEYNATDLETIFSYGVITSNINHAIRTELNAKKIKLFKDSLGKNEFEIQQLPYYETLTNIRACSNGFYELAYKVANNQDNVVCYLSSLDFTNNKNINLKFWLKDVLLDYGRDKNRINNLSEILTFSFSKIYHDILVNSNRKKSQTIDAITINSYNNLSISLKDYIVDTSDYFIPKHTTTNVNESCSLLLVNKIKNKQGQFIIKREYVGFSYTRKDVTFQGISFPVNWVIWDSTNLRKILPDIEYRLLEEYINVLLFIQLTK